MSLANPLWGAPRIHGELLKLGIDVGQTSVAKYMARRRRPPSQGCRTFLRNHADGIAAMDLFVVPTISFRLLYGLLILRHDRRRIIWLGVTAYPTAEWIARQLVEACGWEQVPRYILRDRDDAYGEAFTRRVRDGHPGSTDSSAVSDRSDESASIISSCSGSGTFVTFFCRTHLALDKDAPIARSVQTVGHILRLPILGGLHHHYVRI
jgi:hypothetical protein